MKNRILWVLIIFLLTPKNIFCYRTPIFYKKKHSNLKIWYKRDITYLDYRNLVIKTLKKIRTYIARSEVLGLSATQKSSLEGLVKALEDEMLKTQKKIRRLNKALEEEINKDQPSLKNCQNILSEMNKVWQKLLSKTIQINIKFKSVVSKTQSK